MPDWRNIMDIKIIELNEIIEVCENLVQKIRLYGEAQTGDELYERYKLLVKEFYKKYNLSHTTSNQMASVLKTINDYHWEGRTYTVNILEANIILKAVICLKELLFPGLFEKIFISHREKDKDQIAALMELLYAIGIPRPSQGEDGCIFCSSHPDAYIENGRMIDDEILKQFHSKQNVFFILWYTDNYFESQACLNEMGAVWAMKKTYQEILMPGFDRNKIGGLLPKEKIDFKANDKFRLNTFKSQIEQMFNLQPLKQNTWEIARDAFINKIDKLAINKQS